MNVVRSILQEVGCQNGVPVVGSTRRSLLGNDCCKPPYLGDPRIQVQKAPKSRLIFFIVGSSLGSSLVCSRPTERFTMLRLPILTSGQMSWNDETVFARHLMKTTTEGVLGQSSATCLLLAASSHIPLATSFPGCFLLASYPGCHKSFDV